MADLGALTVAVRLTAEGLQAGISEVQAQLSGIERGADGVDSAMAGASRSIEQSAAKQAAAFAGIAAAALTAFAAIKGAVQIGTEAYNEYVSALKGLESVAGHKQIGQAELSRGLDELTDKFFKTSEASAALKNLLSRGYTLDEAVNTIKRLKDSAAFGRQAHLELGEGVVTATQGLKNENSILVDNAGVTKNVSKMWEDYAKSIGKSTAALTQSERVQAEIKGIMEETQAHLHSTLIRFWRGIIRRCVKKT